MLARLYEEGWGAEVVARRLAAERGLYRLAARWGDLLRVLVENPDAAMEDYEAFKGLIEELVQRNMIVEMMPYRDPDLWLDEPPPERYPELGIGRFYSWPTPIHRDAAKMALGA